MASNHLGEPDDFENMSIIPYDNHRDIVLQHADSVVYFDPESRQLILRNRSSSIDSRPTIPADCPTCGRPFQQDPDSIRQGNTSNPEEQPSFINNDYFRMLARSLPGSVGSSTPPSPRRRTIQPARSRLASPPIIPPPDAEFVGSAPAPPSPSQGISETAFTPQYFEKFFVIEKELGKGGRGVVLLVKHVLDGVTLGHFACKRVPIGDDHTWLEKVLVEVQALQALSHQNLVSYRHVWLEDYQQNSFGPSVPCAFILQQYCNGGDLHNYVCGPAKVQTTMQDLKNRLRRRSRGEMESPQETNKPKKLSFDEIYPFFKDITAGLRFLHLNGFIHRDLKPSNCLIHTINGETRILVSDFGEVQYENATRKSTGATGTISYCAPEVLKKDTPDGPFGNFSFKSDIFSLGMILYFLCFADLPYRYADVIHEEREDLTKLRAEIMTWSGFDDHRKIRPELPSQLYSFLKRLLALRPEERPTAEEVNHGIRLGGLDSHSDTRRRKSTSPEDLAPGKRIQKLDSPARGNSPRPGSKKEFSTQHTTALGHGLGLSQPRLPSNLRHRKRSREGFSPSGTGEVDNTSDIAVEDHDSHSSIGMERSISAPTHGRRSSIVEQSVALVRKTDSALPSPSRTISPRRQQYLLPPPPTPWLATTRNQVTSFFLTDITSSWLRILVLIFKLPVLLQPCVGIGLGMKANVLYPLLLFTVLELGIHRYEVRMMLASVTIHCGIVWYAFSTQSLCQSNTHQQWTHERQHI